MNPIIPPHSENLLSRKNRTFIGVALISIGLIVLLDRFFQTGWLAWLILPILGISLWFTGYRRRRMDWIIPASIISGFGVGSFLSQSLFLGPGFELRLGIFALFFGFGWLLISIASTQLSVNPIWWPLIPGFLISSFGLVFLLTAQHWVDFCLYIITALGIAFLWWGISSHLIGLIIPGGLLLPIGPGIYLAWGNPHYPESLLAQIGILIFSLGLGWGLITLFSRVINEKFLWWPLIPGGVCVMVGWGLYLGGNPDNALNFIGNTGSIGLIIFGLYLLLWRKGIQR